MLRRISILLLTIALPCFAAEDTLILSTAPTHSTDETKKLYKPLADYLSNITGKKVVLEPAANFIQYTSRMQSDRYDILFDGPHLNGWRMDKLNHTPIVRFPGKIRIVVVGTEDTPYTKMSDFGTGSVKACAFIPPNMLTMAFLSNFPNPARQPTMIRVQGFKNLVKCLRSGQGDIAVLRDKLWNKKVDQKGLKLIAYPERSYPERTFSVSSRIDAETRENIRKAILSEEGQKVVSPILKRFNKPKMISASPSQYKGLGELLKSIWGFHR